MKILFLLRYSMWNYMGGAELQAEYLSRELVKRGYEVHQIFDSSKKINYPRDGIVRHLLPDYYMSSCWLNTKKIKKIIRDVTPSLIYQRIRCAYTGIAAYYAHQNNIKMVYHVSSNSNCDRQRVPFDRRFILNMINEHGGRYGVRKADLIIAQTQSQKKALQKNFHRHAEVIPNALYPPSPPFEKANPPLVVWVANLKPWKKPEFFIRLAQELQSPSVRFILAGRSEPSPYLRWLLKKINSVPNLSYLGELSLEKVHDLISQASLFINTSSPREGFPNTYIQAWMRETPVVTLDFDPDDLIKTKNLGFHSGSFQKMAQDVRYLLENQDQRQRMGQAAREYALKNHDMNKVGERFVKEIQKIMPGTG